MLLSLAAKTVAVDCHRCAYRPTGFGHRNCGGNRIGEVGGGCNGRIVPSVAAIGYVPEAIAGTLKVTLKLPPVSGLAVVCNKPLKLTLTLDGYA